MPDSSSESDWGKPQKLSDTGQRVFHCLSLGLVVFDRRLEIMHHNPAAAFLVREHRSIGEALAAATVDAQFEDWRQVLREVIDNGRERRFEQVLYRDDAQGERLLNLLCIALTDPAGHSITGGTLVIEDVTAVAGMEKRLAVSERMAAVGKLAARIAHELNNPLDGILRYLNLASRGLSEDHPERIPEYLERARGGLLRMSEIVRQLVAFSRSTRVAFDGAGINAVLDEAVKVMVDQAIAGNVSVISNLGRDVPATGATNLFQVFCNLIKNAIDAMPDGGTLTVVSEVVEGELVIRFEDTGVGLPDEMERIFEPFFTTKDPGKGTGLGLAICRDIVEKYGGSIVPERRPRGGTVFVLRFPRGGGGAIRADTSSSASGKPRPRFTSAPEEDSDG